ncbi:DUF4232 domain-containing protein [Streptomyces sp. NPDC087300]|uniref:DUF4232 domain-containing protein n=1 Tax=Streptomyces sp. NPDC087300 TaxID=3365780 RepID=UPI003821749A
MNTTVFRTRTNRRSSWSGRSRQSGRACVLAAAAVVAALATTACEPGGSDGSDDAKPTDRPSATGSAEPSAGDSTDGSSDPSSDPSSSGSTDPTSDDGGDGGKRTLPACAQDALAFSSTKEPEDGKEARHLVLVVQNVGEKKCDVYGYPRVRLGADARTTVPVIKDSDPDSGKPVTLAPGDEAYAALLVNGGGRDEYEAESITVTLQGGKPGSEAGGPVDVPMPVKTLHADDGQLVTYWTTASGYALDFIMSK